MEVIIRSKDIKTLADFHNQVHKIPNVPEFYGENLDALNDVTLRFIEPPIAIVWADLEISKANLGNYADRAAEIFRDAMNYVEGYYFELR